MIDLNLSVFPGKYSGTYYTLAVHLCNLSTLSISKCHHTCQHNIIERSAPQSILLLRPPGIVVTKCKLEKCYSWTSAQLNLEKERQQTN